MHKRDIPERWHLALDAYITERTSGRFRGDLGSMNFDRHVQLRFRDGSSAQLQSCFWLSNPEYDELLVVTEHCLAHLFPFHGTEIVELSDEEVFGANRQRLRPYDPSDATETLNLFRDTIRKVNSADYGAEQIDAWASDDIDVENWNNQFAGRFAYVVVLGGRIVGFADMTYAGYLDRLYVSAEHQRQGVGTMLIDKLKSDASESELVEVYTDASITARPFFDACGFMSVRKQAVECRGVEFTNYRMVMGVRAKPAEEAVPLERMPSPLVSPGR